MTKTSRSGNTVYFETGIWYDEDSDCIKIQSKDADFITSVRADPSLKRGHPNLFGKLTKVLRDNGAPAPG